VIFAAIADWAESKTYTVAFMCRELGVSRAGYYAWRAADVPQRAKDDATLIALMRVLHARPAGIRAFAGSGRTWLRSVTGSLTSASGAS
jgi:hypothetical protein